MPFDPFFSSANKKYYVEDPEATALQAHLDALPPNLRAHELDNIYAKPRSERSKAEGLIVRHRSFLKAKHDSASRRLGAEIIANNMNQAAHKTGTFVATGFATTGAHRGDLQNRGLGSVHYSNPTTGRHLHRDFRLKWEHQQKSRLKKKKGKP